MERMLATPADAEIILKLYQLRTETVMRQARAWVSVLTYWEMAAAMVLHGAVSAELFVDCNGEGFFLLAKFAPFLEAVRKKNPAFLLKTSELVNRISVASQRYEAILKNVEIMRKNVAAR